MTLTIKNFKKVIVNTHLEIFIKIILQSYKKKQTPFHTGHISSVVIVECILLKSFNTQRVSVANNPFNHYPLVACDYLKFLTHEWKKVIRWLLERLPCPPQVLNEQEEFTAWAPVLSFTYSVL